MNRLRLQILSLGLLILSISHQPSRADDVDPARAKASADGSVLWFDCRDIGIEGKGWSDTPLFYGRLPKKACPIAPKKDWALTHHTTGMCVRFSTDSPSLQIRWTLTSADLAMPHMPA